MMIYNAHRGWTEVVNESSMLPTFLTPEVIVDLLTKINHALNCTLTDRLNNIQPDAIKNIASRKIIKDKQKYINSLIIKLQDEVETLIR